MFSYSCVSSHKHLNKSVFFPSVDDLTATPAYLIDTPGCRIAYMDPFDPSIMKYTWKLPQLDCTNFTRKNTIYPVKQLVSSNLTSLFVDTSALTDYNITDVKRLKCCYRPLWRVDGDPGNYNMAVDDQSK